MSILSIATTDIERYKLEVESRDGYDLQYMYDSVNGARRTQKWERRRRLGRGGYGEVWQERWVDDHGDSHYRAVKICERNKLRLSQVDYRRELSALAAFSESEFTGLFVNLHGWWMDSVNLSVAMEYLSLGDLSDYIGPDLHETDAKDIMRDVLQGLKVMHGEGFTHRDIKPQIADFGLSKRALQDESAHHTFLGTPDYCAPEVLDADSTRSYTNKVDIWSLGCVLFNISSQGQAPFTIRSLWSYCDGRLPFNSQKAELNLRSDGLSFVEALLRPQPGQRPSAAQALENPWLTDTGSARQDNPATSRSIPPIPGRHNYNSFLASTNSRSLVSPIQVSRKPVTSSPLPERTILARSNNYNNTTVQKIEVMTHEVAEWLDKIKDNGQPPLLHAVADGRLDACIWLLEQGADINQSGERGRAPLHIAVIKRRTEEVRYLIEHGAKVDKRTDLGATPLYEAAHFGYLEEVQILVEYGASIDEGRNDRWTPLHTAAHNGHIEVVQCLVQHKASIEVKNNVKATPLHLAAAMGNIEVVKYLVEHGANMTQRSKEGSTPLHAAAMKGHIEVVKYLVMKGASVNEEDNQGRTPLQRAYEPEYREICKYLKANGAKPVPTSTRVRHMFFRDV